MRTLHHEVLVPECHLLRILSLRTDCYWPFTKESSDRQQTLGDGAERYYFCRESGFEHVCKMRIFTAYERESAIG